MLNLLVNVGEHGRQGPHLAPAYELERENRNGAIFVLCRVMGRQGRLHFELVNADPQQGQAIEV